MNKGCSLRLASTTDLAAVLAIERQCAEASHWSETMWRHMLEPDEAVTGTRAVWIAESLWGLLGFAVVQSAGGGAELESVAVRLEARRCGTARALCGRAIAWASERGATEMHLEVRASNAAALRLYAGLGFAEQGRRGGYYRDPVEDAVVMARQLDGDASQEPEPRRSKADVGE
jgi:ribosomal-protein-alanine N-acetyltransferase